jgi:hypothetical protein
MYGRVQIGKKQETTREIRCFPCGYFFNVSKIFVPGIVIIFELLAVERLFQQSEVKNVHILLVFFRIFTGGNTLNSVKNFIK